MVQRQGGRAVPRTEHQKEVKKKRRLERTIEDGAVLFFTALLAVVSFVGFLFGGEEEKEEEWP